MSAALDLFLARAPAEEGVRKWAYNDATGKTVTCQPGGNLSIGEGINLETGLDAAEIQFLVAHRAGLVETALQGFAWYTTLPSGVQSVLIDMGFNQGLHSLLGYVSMIHYLSVGDWQNAKAQLLDSAAARLLPSRYETLAELLVSSGSAQQVGA